MSARAGAAAAAAVVPWRITESKCALLAVGAAAAAAVATSFYGSGRSQGIFVASERGRADRAVKKCCTSQKAGQKEEILYCSSKYEHLSVVVRS